MIATTPYRTSAHPPGRCWGATVFTRLSVRTAHVLSRLGLPSALSAHQDALNERRERDAEDQAFRSYVRPSPIDLMLVGAATEYAHALKDVLDRYGGSSRGFR